MVSLTFYGGVNEIGSNNILLQDRIVNNPLFIENLYIFQINTVLTWC
jgi:hypothetical protein